MRKHTPSDALAFRWEWIPPVGILIPDLPIWAMDNQLGTLIPRNLTSNPDCFLLRSRTHGCSGIAFALNLPSSIGMRGDMLIFSHYPHLISVG